ncbi:hypothetical protein I2492_01040 [Budviciaceae bacterium CWB-B4]|uniref:Uncharacterized protein n=1 Tax=Limnobaculum xujianqingii TaxID=2738837 RepID=A0A9D7AF96_9GAMM|nr:hypothetical protein [Limnobaculum xujianqingii]MBK5071599.1 hypothetical protein [Limnobaculum xujianqingii]MBK5174908.1 hypothetical protein [Limnobaculum xujianqingii]
MELSQFALLPEATGLLLCDLLSMAVLTDCITSVLLEASTVAIEDSVFAASELGDIADAAEDKSLSPVLTSEVPPSVTTS